MKSVLLLKNSLVMPIYLPISSTKKKYQLVRFSPNQIIEQFLWDPFPFLHKSILEFFVVINFGKLFLMHPNPLYTTEKLYRPLVIFIIAYQLQIIFARCEPLFLSTKMNSVSSVSTTAAYWDTSGHILFNLKI